MKPDWSKAPPWAKFAAMDKCGEWYWHENKPSVVTEDVGNGSMYWHSEGAVEDCDIIEKDWTETLEERK